MTFGPVGVGHALAVRPQESHLPVDVVHADPHVLRVLLQLHGEEGWNRSTESVLADHMTTAVALCSTGRGPPGSMFTYYPTF